MEDPSYRDERHDVHYLRDELIGPLLSLTLWFNPMSDEFRHDAVAVHSQNDALHWGYPAYEGRGTNPFGARYKFT